MSVEISVRPPVAVPPRIVLENIRRRRSNEAFSRSRTIPAATVNVAIAADGAYVAHSAATILSAIDTIGSSAAIHFFVLTDKTLSKKDREMLSVMVADHGYYAIEFIDVDLNAFAWAPLNRPHVSVVTYYRLYIHKLLPDTIDHVIYIDSDAIVVDSLLKLWTVDISQSPIAACGDEDGRTQNARLGLPHSHSYFNAGVMLFNLKYLRSSRVLDAIEGVYQERKNEIKFQDQDLLNIIFCDNYYRLPLKWNINNALFAFSYMLPSYDAVEAQEAAADPGIIHYTGRIKPWNAHCANPFAGVYWYYRNKTPWKENVGEYCARSVGTYFWAKISRTQRRLNRWYREYDNRRGLQSAQ